MRTVLVLVSMFILTAGAPLVSAVADEVKPAPAPVAENGNEKCEHGVTKRLCARCNPKLAAVYKAKGDWCAEHTRPESQCVLCHPELAKKGIK